MVLEASTCLPDENGLYMASTFNPIEVMESFFLSLFGAWGATQAIELYREEENPKTRKVVLALFSLQLGAVAIWAMHFQAMSARNFICPRSHIEWEQHYNVLITLGSMLVAIVFVGLGAFLASKDVFFGNSAEENVNKLGAMLALKSRTQSAQKTTFVGLFENPFWIFAGGVTAGTGVVLMHYTGALALRRTGVRVEWNWGIVALSCVIAVVVATTGFWIMFRLLQWRPEYERLRFLAAVLIAVAASCAHYSGDAAMMLIADDNVELENDTWGPTLNSTEMKGIAALFAICTGECAQMFVLGQTRKVFDRHVSEVLMHFEHHLENGVMEATSLEAARSYVHFNLLESLRLGSLNLSFKPGKRSSNAQHSSSFRSSTESPNSPRSSFSPRASISTANDVALL